MDTTPSDRLPRRGLLALAAATGALTGLPAFTATAAPRRPTDSPVTTGSSRHQLWWQAPADEHSMIEQGLPVGNGRLGALVGNDPGRELLLITDATMWTGGRNDTLDADGQFPYDRANFGSFTLLARLTVDLPDHDLSAVHGYRRTLDLAQGLVTTSYTRSGVTYRRRVFASRPDDVIVLHFTQSGGGRYTGTVALEGTHGEGAAVSFGGAFPNGLRYGAAVTAYGTGGRVTVGGSRIDFAGCRELTVVVSGGTDYAPDAAKDYRDPSLDPPRLARGKIRDAAAHSADTLLRTHVADYQTLFGRMDLSLGTSSAAQRSLDTWERLRTRARDGEPDPELEAAYAQFGRYLMISGSRGSLPLALQGLWLDGNDPDWMGDYHTDINIQMNYWMADRTGLSPCFDALTDYCLAQLPSWTDLTRRLFNDPRNRYRNSTGNNAGWTVAISTNPHGGGGWWWHPAGNAWLCTTLWEHYEYTGSRELLEKIYPLLKGACEFWEARLLTTTLPGTTREVLVADSDWSPEHGPLDAKGITYAQELVWALFGNYCTAAAELRTDTAYADTIAALRRKLYLPRVSPSTGWLEEWMSPDNLGETTHRHLSPLVGLFPGDRIRPDGSTPADIVAGATALLTARGMESFGWANAWRSLCWARLKNAENAYQLVVNNLRPSTGGSNGTASNLFDIYEVERGRGIFQIDANLGTPAAMMEMLLYSRPGHIELLPALPDAWAASGFVRGVAARGGFEIDLRWRDGRPAEARIHSVGGRTTTVVHGAVSRTVTLRPGASVTLKHFTR
ncbi:glycoside hydrolase N-terminal domain-containing protein [Streptomyces sp. ISL-22]|uniref:glycosyl hydrolase family 95 catalytic domain-containing protein n=1 Tax=unclassified Streptomyces TaxID=2593676 RepID=UPI001BEB9AA7|nr:MULTISPECIES: glycoside hydrolase N-terminal domain-containing protein [unclassified Streptomyces]MBT2422415.1 glycoside hydrolase N-terminal domain-containing protein [Streptomyces sp. ISL-24]MBT2436718.1 glycoside hydrolase N-terminal domain-containing protein [Streptomyces sp. ISL-22]